MAFTIAVHVLEPGNSLKSDSVFFLIDQIRSKTFKFENLKVPALAKGFKNILLKFFKKETEYIECFFQISSGTLCKINKLHEKVLDLAPSHFEPLLQCK